MYSRNEPTMSLSITDSRVDCQLCEFHSHSLVAHLQTAHSLSVGEYLAQFPGAATISQEALKALSSRSLGVRRAAIPASTSLSVSLMGMELPVDAGMEEKFCKVLPEGYMFPTKGKAKAVFSRALMAIARGRNCFIWGMPGTGKDALVHAFSAYTRKPCAEITFKAGVDISPWFYTRSIDEKGTGWEYGYLWKILTQGVVGRDGVARPAIVLMSDVDRADSAQAEWFRVLCDSMGGRILDPHGEMVSLFPGTQFVCTANSCGTGDSRGRMTSASPIDASIMDRLGRKIEAAFMDWEDEGKVLRGKFPRLAEKSPEMFAQLGNATEALRKAITDQTLYAEFTHRGLVEILSECDDIVHFTKPGSPVPGNLLKRGFKAWLDGLDSDSRLAAQRLIDPHLVGGSLSEDTE